MMSILNLHLPLHFDILVLSQSFFLRIDILYSLDGGMCTDAPIWKCLGSTREKLLCSRAKFTPKDCSDVIYVV